MTSYNYKTKNVTTLTSPTKHSTAFTYVPEPTGSTETWNSITTTWASETRTWDSLEVGAWNYITEH